jgi:DNA-binding response OmpR family regulator
MRDRDRILVVEDDADSCELIATVLGQAGYTVDAVLDGFEALAIVASSRPDLVLTDLQMPGMNGIELIRRVHAIDHTLPVVLTTGADTRDLCTAPAAYGAVACMTKPINLDELLWTIECALACRRGAANARGAAVAMA